MDTNIIDKFTTHLKNVLTHSLYAVLEIPNATIEPIHLLWALVHERGSVGSEILRKVKISEPEVKAIVPSETGESLPLAQKTKKAVREVTPKLSDDSKRVIEKAVLTANLYEHRYVGTEHLLSGLLQVEESAFKKFLAGHGVELKTLRSQVTLVLKSTSKFPDITNSLDLSGSEIEGMGTMGEPIRERRRVKKVNSKTPALDFFSVDLTDPHTQESIDPVIGREPEIERIMQVLCRRTKNNPILLGEPGVGKTAIVEGLAKKISQNDVPDVLQGKRILSLDLGLVIAGTMYRGEFEGRLKQIIDEVKADPRIILFIDEVHTIIGAGSASGSLDAANILKPALARGDIRCVGATTLAEYKKHIESDPALERRFQSILVNEPTAEKTLLILEGIKKNYETYHGVTISKDALETAVRLAERYLQEKFFPDKAIDLVDEAASSLRVRQKASVAELKIRARELDLNQLREEKRQAILEERFMEAIALKEKERLLEMEIRGLRRKGNKKKSGNGRISGRTIAEIISRMTGIPTAELIDSERKRLENLEKLLEEKILGQTETVRAVAEYVRRAKTGVVSPTRPLASFLFVGPSGVGKTELAKTLALEIFQDRDALIRLDMSEFAEGFTVTKLIGAPAGYVGYRDSAKLTDLVKRKPYAVILFDELEKAHPDVISLLLQILDEGHLTDATGRTVNFKNTIIIMTSNVGSELVREARVGFSDRTGRSTDVSDGIRRALAERFRPEFLNRIDRICVFESLGPATLRSILDLQINELNTRLEPHRLRVSISDEVAAWMVDQGTKTEHGARALRRVVQDTIEGQIASLLLRETSPKMKTIHFVLRDGKVVIEE